MIGMTKKTYVIYGPIWSTEHITAFLITARVAWFKHRYGSGGAPLAGADVVADGLVLSGKSGCVEECLSAAWIFLKLGGGCC